MFKGGGRVHQNIAEPEGGLGKFYCHTTKFLQPLLEVINSDQSQRLLLIDNCSASLRLKALSKTRDLHVGELLFTSDSVLVATDTANIK